MADKKIILVVGAGPAGMMAAIRAGELGADVTLIEKNSGLGKKLLLSGKGRCNLTNACELDLFLRRFSHHGEFLRDAFRKFFNLDLIEFFKKRGLKLRVERQLRVFPETDRSVSILEVLKRELNKNKVKILYNSCLKDILVKDNIIKGLRLKEDRLIKAERVILASGGASFSFTGSNGEGIEIARRLGHEIIPLRAGLVPLKIKEGYPRLLEGLALKNIRLRFSNGKKEIASEIGELLFTSFGISGPLVLSFSGRIVDWLKEGNRVFLKIDLKPALSKEQLNARLLREFKLRPRHAVKNILKDFLPVRLINVSTGIAKVNPDKKANQVTQGERAGLVGLFKEFPAQISGSLPIEEAMVTRGGVCLKDINPRTMESRIVKGLYFAGEMIDIDADTGGFNLQAAFSTGYLAGETAALL